MKKNSKKLLLIVTGVCFIFSCKKIDLPHKGTKEPPEIIYRWYKLAEVIQRPLNPQPSPIAANRNFAYIGVGVYESVQPGIKGAISLSHRLYHMPVMPAPEWGKDYFWSASANAALASLFKKFLGGLSDENIQSIDSMEAVNNQMMSQLVSDAILERSQAFGRAIADAILAWSVSDNFNLGNMGYTIPVFTGSWVPTPLAFAPPVGPFLKDSRPFLEYSLTAVAPPPIPYSVDPNSHFYAEAKMVYDISIGLTDEQKAIADWFADSGGPGVGLPSPYHIISFVTAVLEKQHLDLGKAAEMYARVGIGQKDGPINTFRSKYTYNLLRPVTFIREEIDPDWLSYLPNPPYPDYTSGLVGLYAPIVQVLIREFGDEPCTDDANTWRGDDPRHYSSLSEFLEEAATSRVYAGIHYVFTQTKSIEFGKELGDRIAKINFHGGGVKR
jgi:hypothetical protein